MEAQELVLAAAPAAEVTRQQDVDETHVDPSPSDDVLDRDSLFGLLQSPTGSEFLETPAPGASKQSALRAEKAWVEAEKAKLELARAQMEAENTALKAQMKAEKVQLEMERARLEVEKEKAQLASERAWVEAEKAKLEAERTRQETKRMLQDASRDATDEAAPNDESTEDEVQAQQGPREDEAKLPKAPPLSGNDLMVAVRRHLAAHPDLGPRELHDELLDEGFAVEIGVRSLADPLHLAAPR